MKAVVRVMGDYQREYRLGEINTVGRDISNTICIQDRLVSRHHAEIRRIAKDKYEIVDLGSTHGTYVERQRISQQALADGDEIFVGATRIYFREALTESIARRWDERVDCDIPLRVKIGSDEEIEARAMDISLGGMRLAIDREMDVGMIVELSILFPRTRRRMAVKARVMHAGSGHSGVGVFFIFKSNRDHRRLAKQFQRILLSSYHEEKTS